MMSSKFVASAGASPSPASPRSVPAQSTTQGAISGTVFDATDAAVPNATILIHNDGTNAELTLTSNGSGFFRAPQLAPGTYTVTISAAGFNTQRSNAVTVEVNLVTEVNPHLQLGGATQVVEVTAEVPVLKFDTACLRRPADQRRDREHPHQQPPLVVLVAAHARRHQRLPGLRADLLPRHPAPAQ